MVGAVFVPGDGYIDPSGLTMALAKAARAGGVKIHEGARVVAIEVDGRRAAIASTQREAVM